MKKYTIVLFFLLLSACELIVDVDVPFERPSLTLNSFFTPDSLWYATVDLNRHILDESPIEGVDNALLIVFDGEVAIDTLTNESNGEYRSDTGTPLSGKEYTIRCQAPGYEPVTGRSAIPAHPVLTDVQMEDVSSNPEDKSLIRIKFQDDGSIKNYYQVMLEVERENYDSWAKIIRRSRYKLQMEAADQNIYSQYVEVGNSFLIKDILFNGKEAELVFKVPAHQLINNAGVILSLRTLSEEFYKYKTTAQVQDETSDNPFAQPVNVYKNIENGFGIFAGYNNMVVYRKQNPVPVIHDISPLKGKPGDSITITGENFGTTDKGSGYGYVIFSGQGNIHATIRERDDQHIKVTVPPSAVTGKIVLSLNGRIVFSEEEFEVL
jgi:hypothetical protein